MERGLARTTVVGIVTVIALGVVLGAATGGVAATEVVDDSTDLVTNSQSDDNDSDDDGGGDGGDDGGGDSADSPSSPEKLEIALQNLVKTIANFMEWIGAATFLIGLTMYGTGTDGARAAYGQKLLIGGLLIVAASFLWPAVMGTIRAISGGAMIPMVF